MAPAELDRKLAIEDEFENFAKAMWCLSTASRPYWRDVRRMLDFQRPAVCRRHLRGGPRCSACGRPEGLPCFDSDDRATLGPEGRCQDCAPAGLTSLQGAA